MHHFAPSGQDVAVCASRASALAMTQTRTIAAKVAQSGIASTILNVTTTGDRNQTQSFAQIGSENIFVKELETALRDGRAQYAVHSCKDLPSTLPPDMQIAAISQRDDPRDVFCSERYERFADLPRNAIVGTSSVRRRAQLAALRADLRYDDLRGNVDTRLRKLREGPYDAIVLASAGLRRLGARASFMVPFDVTEVVPAAGQGALALETLAGAPIAARLRQAVNDERSERAVLCERAALAALRGGCQAPIGIHAFYDGESLVALGAIAAQPGAPVLFERVQGNAADGSAARALGEALAGRMTCGR
ncbi:MAG: hydroxymethylbilane synthase [Candidatus Baltobacteraceae bacterium]